MFREVRAANAPSRLPAIASGIEHGAQMRRPTGTRRRSFKLCSRFAVGWYHETLAS